MSRDTIQIRLAQPPIYLMGAVILASLLPLVAQLFGGAADGVERLRRLAFAGMHVEQLEPREAAAVVAVEEDEEAEEDHVEIVVLEPVVDRVVVEEPKPATKSRPTKLSASAKAKAACARQDRDAARAAYKSLERGDPRRKEVRKACRKSGVWFL